MSRHATLLALYCLWLYSLLTYIHTEFICQTDTHKTKITVIFKLSTQAGYQKSIMLINTGDL
jgi:hypothetical protein